MKLNYMLEEFDNIYMRYDSVNGKVLELYPPFEAVNLPCNILNILRMKKFHLNIAALNKIEVFIKNSKDRDCINVQGEKGWYCIESKRIDEETFILHLYSLSNTMDKIKNAIYKEQLDPLTNALQKNAIQTYVSSVLKEHPEKEATMFMLDVDYFKNINDNFGHIFGDKVIVAVAKALHDISGKSGKVGRIGGDEFILFVEQGLDRLGMKNIARLIRYVLDNLEVDGKPFSCTATIGICQYPKFASNFIELYNCCDKALYRGKEKGRDCHIIYDPMIHLGPMGLQEEKKDQHSVQKLSLPTFIAGIVKGFLKSEEYSENDVFKQIADFFNLDRIIIYRTNTIELKYAKTQELINIDEYIKIPFESYKEHFIMDDLLYINDTRTWRLTQNKIYDIYEKCGTSSAVQVLIFDANSTPSGFISYEIAHTKRVWQRGELNAFAILTKIINAFKNFYK